MIELDCANPFHNPSEESQAMAQIIIQYKLKPTVSAEEYENWTLNRDYPTMRGLKRVQRFVNYRVERNLLSDAKPSVNYIEFFEIPDLQGFISDDMAGLTVQTIMGEFLQYVENPEFLVATEVA